MISSTPFKTLSFVLLFPFFMNGITYAFSSFDNKTFLEKTALRTYCRLGNIFGNVTVKCFDENKKSVVQIDEKTLSEDDIQALVTKKVTELFAQLNGAVTRSGETFGNRITRVIERTIVERPIVTNNYITQSPVITTNQAASVAAVVPTTGVSGYLQAFANIPQPFWNGAGSSGNTSGGTIVNNTISPLPTGGTLGQVLTVNASGTAEWIFPTISTSSTSTFPTLFASNGLTLSTTSTSSLVEFGGLLNKNTSITQGANSLVFTGTNSSTNRGTLLKLGRGGSGAYDFDLTATTTNAQVTNSGTVNTTNAANSITSFYDSGPFSSLVSRDMYVENSYASDSHNVLANNGAPIGYQSTISAAVGGSVNQLEQFNYSNGYNQRFERNITIEAAGNVASALETLDWADGLGIRNSQIFFNRNISTNNDATIELGTLGIFGASTTNQTLQIDKSGISFGRSGLVSTFGYRFPTTRGASSTVMALNASGVLSFVPLSSLALGGGTIAQNGLAQVSTSTIEFGGSLLHNTTINQSFRDLSFTYTNASAPLTLMNGGQSFNLQPAFPYNLKLSGGFSTTSYAVPTSLAFGRTALGLSTSFAGLSEDSLDLENPYFNARNYIALSDGSADVNVINNSMYGPEMSYHNYGPTLNEIRKRSYVQTRNDGGFYAVGSDESLGARADLALLPDATSVWRAFTYNSASSIAQASLSRFGGISFNHTTPGFTTTLSLATSTGLRLADVAATYTFPRTGVASGTVMGFDDASGQLKFITLATSTAAGNTGQIQFNNGGAFAATSSLFWDNTNGRLGVGTSTPATKLQVIGDIRVGTSGSNGCIENFAGTALVGTCSSDENLKTNIVDLNTKDIAERFSKLRFVSYNWNETAGTLYKRATDQTAYGILAQDVALQFPELVHTDDKNYKTVDTTTLTWYGLASLKESLSTFSDSLFSKLRTWFADVSNGITKFFAKEVETEKLCISENGEKFCISKDDLRALKNLIGSQTSNNSRINGGGTSASDTTPLTGTSTSPTDPNVPTVSIVSDSQPVIDPNASSTSI